tara:strand:- start:242 stop:445 length:204 start_codon:yes stop_codon:yes gene_type:complete
MRFKVGDLVTLSAAGRKSQQNYEVLEGFGIVINLSPLHWHNYPIECTWVGGDIEVQTFKEYELKKFK